MQHELPRLRPEDAHILTSEGRPTWRYRVEPFRHAFLHGGPYDQAHIERCAGWSDGYLSRVLGLRPEGHRRKTVRHTLTDGTNKMYVYEPAPAPRQTIGYDVAAKLARAMDLCYHRWYI